ncbi:MAG: hypothetical protein LBC86_06850 [Oscillospiraceae bacterium]|jgi:hypothetical protein|nr:hypothetical protein [Oscillospiraceae bacterium]
MLNNANNTSSYREVKIDKTLYVINSSFTGEKELGATLEKLAVRCVLDEMGNKSRKTLI